MPRMAACLAHLVMQVEDGGQNGYLPDGHTRQRRRLPTIDFGFDLCFGLGPRLKLVFCPADNA
jgi:hypothetical protein